MGAVLLDTSVASLLHPKRAGSEAREFYAPHMRGKVLAISFQTQAELWAWAEDGRWGRAMRTGLDQFLARFPVIPYTEQLGRTWARVMTEARRSGRRLEAGDGWIAASAVLYSMPLLTQDGDFLDLALHGLEVISHLR